MSQELYSCNYSLLSLPASYISPTLLNHPRGYINMALWNMSKFFKKRKKKERNMSWSTHFPPGTILLPFQRKGKERFPWKYTNIPCHLEESNNHWKLININGISRYYSILGNSWFPIQLYLEPVTFLSSNLLPPAMQNFSFSPPPKSYINITNDNLKKKIPKSRNVLLMLIMTP